MIGKRATIRLEYNRFTCGEPLPQNKPLVEYRQGTVIATDMPSFWGGDPYAIVRLDEPYYGLDNVFGSLDGIAKNIKLCS